MKINVYCDENHPELFTSQNPTAKFLMIGSIWIEDKWKDKFKKELLALREKHQIWGEIKWRKVSKTSFIFYQDLIDLFESYKHKIRFRCIAVDSKKFQKSLHNDDEELGFYKFYYQVLNHWIDDYNEYNVFCDLKTNYDLKRLHTLKACLSSANIMAEIKTVQALPSKEVVLIQLTDFLLGMTSACLNETLNNGSYKEKLVNYYKEKHNRKFLPTYKNEFKFNIFQINLKGGW